MLNFRAGGNDWQGVRTRFLLVLLVHVADGAPRAQKHLQNWPFYAWLGQHRARIFAGHASDLQMLSAFATLIWKVQRHCLLQKNQVGQKGKSLHGRNSSNSLESWIVALLCQRCVTKFLMFRERMLHVFSLPIVARHRHSAGKHGPN